MTVAVIKIVRVGTWVIVGTLALLGLVTVGAAVLVPAVVAAVAGGLVGWAMARYRSVRPSATLLAVLAYAGATAVGVLAIAGLAVLAGPGAIPAVCALAGALVWTRRRRSPHPTTTAPALPDGPSLTGLTNAQLARQWQTSYADLAAARDPWTLERVCTLRRRQLDEIERRDPTGFHRWISSGYWVRGDSAPFLGG